MSYGYQQQPPVEPKQCVCGSPVAVENEQHRRPYMPASQDPNQYDGRPYSYFVHCPQCNLDTEAYKSRKEAVNRWNYKIDYRLKNQQQYGKPQQAQQQYNQQPQQAQQPVQQGQYNGNVNQRNNGDQDIPF